MDAYADMVAATTSSHMDVDGPSVAWGAEETQGRVEKDPRECIVDIREYDVPYYLRVAMDNEIRVGIWYGLTFNAGQPSFKPIVDRVKRPDPVVVAYDIETTKAPLKVSIFAPFSRGSGNIMTIVFSSSRTAPSTR